MSAVLWLVAEVLVGVLIAGVVVAALVGASVEGGYPAAPWMVWTGVILCVALTVSVGEWLRRSRRKV